MQNKVQARVISLRYTIYENTAAVGKCANRGHAETQAEVDRKTKLARNVGSLPCTASRQKHKHREDWNNRTNNLERYTSNSVSWKNLCFLLKPLWNIHQNQCHMENTENFQTHTETHPVQTVIPEHTAMEGGINKAHRNKNPTIRIPNAFKYSKIQQENEESA